MKKLSLVVFIVLVSVSLWAQAPQKMCYQAVVRNTSDQLLVNKQVGMKVYILQGAASDSVVFSEIHTPTTNANGLVTIVIGAGKLVSGDFSNIDWSKGEYYIQTDNDPEGGTNYTISGKSQLLSVPYALYTANSQPGPKGDQGPQGLQGPQGEKGDQGPEGIQGEKGDKGPQGDKGLDGAPGVKGDKGDVGAQGPQGIKGDDGDQGPIGLTGPQGAQGSQGLKGDQGLQGLKGDQGDQGTQGVKGPKGDTGFQGPVGLTAPQGLQGIKGDVGNTGAQGPKGQTGEQGAQGPIGLTGPQGSQGLKGEQGDAGLQGPIGITGTQGPKGLKGDKGDTGPQGPKGATGDTGAQGSVGLTGAQGPNGLKGDQGDTGAQGPKGLPGDTGAQGPIGLTGAQGPKGLKGDTGDTGAQGPKGVTGDTGAQGSVGIIGTQGLYGLKGDAGDTGPQGPKGITGDTGVQGIAGLTGPQGPQGVKGDQGDQGLKGQTGDQGDGFPNGTAKNQLAYWNGTTWDLVPPVENGQILTICNGALTWTLDGKCSGKISSIDCNGANTTGTLTAGIIANGVSTTISYTGGDGGDYSAQTISSTGITGLIATLQAGTLASGNGSLTYVITGTPSGSGSASFAILFGGQSCTYSVIANPKPASGYGDNINDIDGNSYKTVYIGSQQWMAENLKTSKYNDGTSIPNITDNTQWSQLTTGAWSYYNNDPANNTKYGKLYNWYSVSSTTNSNKNVCPTGWHVPTDGEWTVLTDYLGGSAVAGSKMKEVGTLNWISQNTDATNSSLFSGLPGGYRDENIYCYNLGGNGYFCSSTEGSTGTAWYRSMGCSYSNAYRFDGNKRFGFSVRCLRD